MKNKLFPLILSCFFLLTSMSECKRGNVPLLQYTYECPITAELNGILYQSEEYTQLAWGDMMSAFKKYEEGQSLLFSFYFMRDISTIDGDEITIRLFIEEDEDPFELNKKYKLTNSQTRCGKIFYYKNAQMYEFVSNEGYVVFTQYDDYHISGNFEFTAIDTEHDLTLEVTNGTFENFPKD